MPYTIDIPASNGRGGNKEEDSRTGSGIAVIGGGVSSTIPALYILFCGKPKKNEPEESKK